MDLIAKTGADYDKIAKHFSASRHRLWPELDQFKPFIEDGQRILDWGCGSGRLLELRKNKSIRYCGLDLSRELIKIARQKYRDLIKTGLARFYCSAKQRKSFPADYFDLVFMVASFHHLPTIAWRRQILKQIFKEIKPGGWLIITVWNLGSEWAKAKLKKDYQKIGARDFLVPWKNPAGQIVVERYYHYFKKTELKKLLEEAGFKVEPFKKYNSGSWPNRKGGQNLVAVAHKPISKSA